MFKFYSFAICLLFIYNANGHGMVLDPVNRSSRWRYNTSAPSNYEDNQLFCGGFGVQWNSNEGKCGLCGDNYQDKKPRPNELGGKFGEGISTGSYTEGDQLQVSIQITANHLGYFYFKLCNLDESSSESEQCFDTNPLKLTNGNDKYELPNSDVGIYNVFLHLPKGLSCDHCVLQWTYRTGNSWGICDDGSGKLGCGPQENFRTCSDIRIVKNSPDSDALNEIVKEIPEILDILY